MIVTLTANPAIDRLIRLDATLQPGSVVRSQPPHDDPGGKGINVARVLASAGEDVLAVMPSNASDPLLRALRAVSLPAAPVGIDEPVRINLTITDPDGITTKINAPGPRLSTDVQDGLVNTVLNAAEGADWAVLSGSLPPGVPAGFYAQLTAHLRARGTKVAVDTSGAPLAALFTQADAAPDVIKPNGAELADLIGGNEQQIESDPRSAIHQATALLKQSGLGAILLTLGGAGAALITGNGSWFAAAPQIDVRSTVGAGDSSLAGYLIARVAGRSPQDCLASAVAFGSAAATLPGSSLPTPTDAAHYLGSITPHELSSFASETRL